MTTYDVTYDQALTNYWEVSENLAEFLELIQDSPALFSYFLENYGDYREEA